MAFTEIAMESGQIPQTELVAGMRVRRDVAFTNAKGVEKTSLRKRAERTLQKLQEPLRKLLTPDETIFCVIRAQAPASLFERMTIGWYIYRITATVLVLTNRRLLHFACDSRGNWTRSTRSIGWGELASASAKSSLLSGTFQLKLRNGHSIRYWAINRGDTKKLQKLVPTLLSSAPGSNPATGGMPYLCPECFAVLTSGVYQCGKCGLTFRDEKTMVRRSLLIPGGGYFYCKQTFLGLADFVTEAVLTVVVLVLALDAAGIPGPNSARDTSGSLTAAIIFAALLAVEKALTIHHCRRFIREFIPLRKGTLETSMPPRAAGA